MKFLIIAITILVVVITAVTIMTGSSVFDGVVVEKPYETGLDWDKVQEKKTRLGWTLSTKHTTYRIGRNVVSFMVRDRNGTLLQDALASVKVSRPATVQYDRTSQAAPGQDGSFSAVIDLPSYGKWDLIISVKNGADVIEFVRPVFVEREP